MHFQHNTKQFRSRHYSTEFTIIYFLSQFWKHKTELNRNLIKLFSELNIHKLQIFKSKDYVWLPISELKSPSTSTEYSNLCSHKQVLKLTIYLHIFVYFEYVPLHCCVLNTFHCIECAKVVIFLEINNRGFSYSDFRLISPMHSAITILIIMM